MQPNYVFLQHSIFNTGGNPMAATAQLNPNAKRMVKGMKALMAHISARDSKVAASPRPGQQIFPYLDTALQQALAVVSARLNTL